MITNTRLQELRATGLVCQKRVLISNPKIRTDLSFVYTSQLEKDYADLYQLILDEPEFLFGKRNVEDRNGIHLDILLGK